MDADVHDVACYCHHPEFLKYLYPRTSSASADAEQFIGTIITDNILLRRRYWSIYHRNDKKVIGTLGFIPLAGFKDCEIGFGISPHYWGRGYAYESLSQIIDYAQESGVDILRIRTRSDNIAACSIARKLGFQQHSTLSEFYRYSEAIAYDAALFRKSFNDANPRFDCI